MVDLSMIQTAAAVVTALAAAGAFAYVRRGMRLLNEHDRVLYGEDAVDGWNGIVSLAHKAKTRTDQNRQIIKAHHDVAESDFQYRGGSNHSEPGD